MEITHIVWHSGVRVKMYNPHFSTEEYALFIQRNTPTQLIPTSEEEDVDVVNVTNTPKIVQVPAVFLLALQSSGSQQATMTPTKIVQLNLTDVTSGRQINENGF